MACVLAGQPLLRQSDVLTLPFAQLFDQPIELCANRSRNLRYAISPLRLQLGRGFKLRRRRSSLTPHLRRIPVQRVELRILRRGQARVLSVITRNLSAIPLQIKLRWGGVCTYISSFRTFASCACSFSAKSS